MESSAASSRSDNASATDTLSSSGMADTNVAIFLHYAICQRAQEVEEILKQRNLSCCIAYRDMPAGRLRTSNIHSVAKHSLIRVYILTRKFVSEDLAHHESVLGNPRISTIKNTLFLTIGKGNRFVPKNMKHFRCESITTDMSSSEIARHILNFLFENYPDDMDLSGDVQQQLNIEGIPDEIDEKRDALADKSNLDKSGYEDKRKRFESMFGQFGVGRGYVLVTSPIRDKFPGMKNIALIPWLRVFDFDPKSGLTGLLSEAESTLKKSRNFIISDSRSETQNPDDKTTNWVFVNGYCDNPAALFPANSVIPKPLILNHSRCLGEYCQGRKVPTILVMWYPADDKNDRNLEKFIQGIQFFLGGNEISFSCVICVEEFPTNTSSLYGVLERLDLLDCTLRVPLEILCIWLDSLRQPACLVPAEVTKKTLPKCPDEDESDTHAVVQNDELICIEVYFDLLVMPYLPAPGPETDEGDATDHDAGLKFLKGREITWKVMDDDKYHAKRDLFSSCKNHVEKKYIQTGKSGEIRIFHSPSGGGTTFARRLLWELRTTAPCAELTAAQLNMEEIRNILMKINYVTRLPIVLLVDGRSDHDIKKIMEISRDLPLIVLHVQRYYAHMKEACQHDDRFYLPDWVTREEAELLEEIFTSAAPTSKLRLKYLTDQTKRGKRHIIFEYGLAAFFTKFSGVRRYVHGYLQIAENDEIQQWHTVLAFLSMANYYGHMGLPSKLFGKVLAKDDEEVVELEDLPHSARQFIDEDARGNWKISHYVVSKVILEQIFVKRATTDYDMEGGHLTNEARKHLCFWALKFIDNIKSHFPHSRSVPNPISEILTSIFIKRYYNDPGEKESESKSHFSRLLEETENRDHQLAILQKLVDCFHDGAEFHAHLGRFYCKNDNFEDAEKCLSEAVRIRISKLSQSALEKDDVLERIYNMFGFCYNYNIKHAIGAPLGRISHKDIERKMLPTLIRLCLKKARKAVEYFGKGRKCYQKGSNPTFSYLGEIKARLHLTELASVIAERDLQRLKTMPAPYDELHEFVMNSFYECDQLLAHCIYYSSGKELPEDEINFCTNNFQYLFSSARAALEKWTGEDSSIVSKRSHISIFKMHLRQINNHRLRIYDDIVTTEDLKFLVSQYEGVLDDATRKEHQNIHVSNYMMEWLQSIRHKYMKPSYTQSGVLARVKKWVERKEVGSLAVFYEYVLNTLMSLSLPQGKVANTYSKKAADLKKEVNDPTVPLYLLGKSMEWLGSLRNPQSFNALVNFSALGEKSGKFWTNKEALSKLSVCFGTIERCYIHYGEIIIDGGQVPSISVFFVPVRYDIGVAHSRRRTRVEFYLGFNPRHGAEAYEVKILEKYFCPRCKNPTEIPTLGKDTVECTSQCIRCETVVTTKCPA